jgi:hypothetical protein
MNKICFLAAIVIVFVVQSAARSQSPDPPKFEVAGEFTTLERESFLDRITNPGFGGRFTYNLNRVFSLEGAVYFFRKPCLDCVDPGRLTAVVGGVKAGKRFDSWGIFGKARPGVVHFSDVRGAFVTCLSPQCAFPTEPFRPKRTHFAIDIGGGVEFYPSKRIVTRFDAGDMIIRFGSHIEDGLRFNQMTFRLEPAFFHIPGRIRHNFQFIAGVGLRF